MAQVMPSARQILPWIIDLVATPLIDRPDGETSRCPSSTSSQRSGTATDAAGRTRTAPVIEAVPAFQRDVDVQSLAARRLDEGGEAEFVLKQCTQAPRQLTRRGESGLLRRVEVEYQLIRLPDTADPPGSGKRVAPRMPDSPGKPVLRRFRK